MSPSVQLKHRFMRSITTIYLHGFQRTVFTRLMELYRILEKLLSLNFTGVVWVAFIIHKPHEVQKFGKDKQQKVWLLT